MKMPLSRSIFAAVAASATLPARASTFTIGGTTNTFIVTRSGEGIDSAETVRYRTVSLSAFAGQHFTSKSGTLTFAAGQTALTNTVTETSPSAAAYRFQTGSNRSYRFELTDEGGFPITNKVRTITTGTSVSSSNAFGSKNLTINSGTITVTDGGYDQAYHSVTVNSYFNAAAPKDFLVAAGATFADGAAVLNLTNERATVTLTATWVSPWGLLQRQLDAGGTVTLMNDVAAMDGDSFLTVTNAVTLDLNGHTLTHNGNGQVLNVENGGDLTLTNSLAAGAVTGGGDHGVYVVSNAMFRLQGGAISGNTASYGGGVYVDEGGTFTMPGGAISDNTADYGGGVFMCEGGTFTMTGGTISGNAAEIGGGGVYVSYRCGLTVSGCAVVSGNTNDVGEANNVYLDDGVIAVSNLTAGASIGVTTYTAPATNSPITIATGALAGDEDYFFSDNPGCHVERDGSTLLLAVGSPAVFKDPQGQEIGDQAVVGWLSDNGFTQTDINNLGNDATATDKLYECFLLNCDFTAQDAGGALSLTGIAVSNGVVSVTVQLVRTALLGIINGVLNLYGATDLAAGFGRSPIAAESISFGAGDSTFATAPTTGTVTQSVTATFSVSDVSARFFKAVIEAYPRDFEID